MHKNKKLLKRTVVTHTITGIFCFKLSLPPPSYRADTVRASQMGQASPSRALHAL